MEANDNVKAVQSGDLLESESECRKQFEETYRDFNKCGRNPDGTYGDWNLELTWKCWDAAWHCALKSTPTTDNKESTEQLLNTAVLCLAYVWEEMNVIRARDGVPRMYDGSKSSVTQEWWDELMNKCEEVILAKTGKQAHCNPILFPFSVN